MILPRFFVDSSLILPRFYNDFSNDSCDEREKEEKSNCVSLDTISKQQKQVGVINEQLKIYLNEKCATSSSKQRKDNSILGQIIKGMERLQSNINKTGDRYVTLRHPVYIKDMISIENIKDQIQREIVSNFQIIYQRIGRDGFRL